MTDITLESGGRIPHALKLRLSPSARILILGGPRTGKTTLGRQLERLHGIPLRSTDSLIREPGMDWSGVSARVADWLDEPGPWCIEGTRTVHALRKWRARRESARGELCQSVPFDVAVWLGRPRVQVDSGQVGLAKGCATIWRGLEPWVRRVGGVVVDG